jgi:hypothetical protein
MILCPPSPNPRPDLTRRCSRSCTATSSPYPPLQPSRPGLTRRCSIFQPYPPCLSSQLDLRILRVRFSQSYPPNAPSSSAHLSRILQVCFSLPSPRLLRVHLSPPSQLLSSKSIPCLQVHLRVPGATFLLRVRYYPVVVKKNEISPPWPFV